MDNFLDDLINSLSLYQKSRLETLTVPGYGSMKDYIQNRENFDRIKSGLAIGWGKDINDIETINYISNYDSIPAGVQEGNIKEFYKAYAKWRKSGDVVKPNELLQFYQEGGRGLKKSKKKRKHRKRSKKISKKSYKKRRKHRKRTKRH